ncbi:MAG: NAD(P)-dependent oxidoreductase [Terrimicrobiaceae bacterium]|nr:NAD(P)-dependent oxidoreductase [Terrimicrobiaceae bacterium]
MKVAIIGANGFIGSRIVEQFYLNGTHTAIPVVRKPASLALPSRFAIGWRLGDALDSGSLAAALNGCEAVVHCAIGDPRQIEQMPAVLCEAAEAAGVNRVVYLSSASVHGQNAPDGSSEESPLHETHSIEYNNAKVRAENAFFSEATKRGIEGYALRPGVVYGPRSRWIADLAAELRGGRAWLYEGGTGICNGIYVDNLIAAIGLCLEAKSGAGQAYLVGDRETTSWADFYHLAADSLGVPRASIHRLPELPVFRKPFRERVENAVAQPWVQSLLPAVPGKVKQVTKTLLSSWNPPRSPDAWSLPSSPQPRITEEMALLQQCHCKLPHTKAAQTLGYEPPVPFAEGMRRSFAWLEFATSPS